MMGRKKFIFLIITFCAALKAPPVNVLPIQKLKSVMVLRLTR